MQSASNDKLVIIILRRADDCLGRRVFVDPANRGILSHRLEKPPFLLCIKLRRMNDFKLRAAVPGKRLSLCKHGRKRR